MKYVKHLTLGELAERLAAELVDSHKATAIDLGYWETARELVERYYRINVDITVLEKKESK